MENLSLELIIIGVGILVFGFVLKQLLDIRGILSSMGRITDSMIGRCDRMINTIDLIDLKSIKKNKKLAIKQLKKKNK